VKALTIIAATAVLLFAPAAATADLPVGEADGVRVVREHGGIVVVFTAKAQKLYERIAGKRVLVSCTELLEDGASTGEGSLRAPRQRGRLVTGDRTRGMDFCRVWLAPRTVKRHGQRLRMGRRLIVSIPLTQRGAVFIDEETKTRDMLQLGLIASLLEEKDKLPGHPTYEQLIAKFPRLAKPVVKLAAPSDTPPAGKVGYFSDGVEHVALVTVSASGRRLFIETAADDYFATNVAKYIFNEPY
jgi:hypothetical protein